MSSSSSLKPAVFLDRDGTIIEDRGYLSSAEEVVFYPGVFQALKKLQEYFELFIVTNQSGVSRGIHSREDVDAVNAHVEDTLRSHGVDIKKTYSCYHQRQDNCPCIKPLPYFPQRAALEYGLSLEHSWAIGDHYHDVELAENFGGRGIYVLTGHGERHLHDLPAELEPQADLVAAADYIINNRTDIEENYLNLQEAAAKLKAGETVAIPTETVYGLAGDGLNESAVLKIFDAKNRPHFDPLILHVATLDQARELTADFPAQAEKLAEAFWPGPLTMVLPRSSRVPDLVTSGLDTVAIRMPAHPMARKIIEMTGTPLAAPSANPFGAISPTRACHVNRQLGDRIGGIVDGGASTIGIESTILGWTREGFRLLRPGGIAVEEIEKVIGPVQDFKAAHDRDIPAPGTMKRHYSPRTPMVLLNAGESAPPQTGKDGFLIFGEMKVQGEVVENLSAKGDLKEAAIHLYHYMRLLDRMDLDRIVAYRVPQEGIGRGINDRLERAAARD